jgi:hypothetical protein
MGDGSAVVITGLVCAKLARDKRPDNAVIQLTRFIVEVHREQARSHKSGDQSAYAAVSEAVLPTAGSEPRRSPCPANPFTAGVHAGTLGISLRKL